MDCQAFGNDGIEETLLPIPNRKVKLYSADGTAWETVWESRMLPGFYFGSIAQSVEQRTENPRVPGSIPGRATRLREWLSGRASPCQGERREFESRLPLHNFFGAIAKW